MASSYERIDVPDAVRFKTTCRGTAGPPSMVYFPFHGIFISFNFSLTTLGLHIPEGMTVLLNDNIIKIHGVSKSGQVEKTVHINAFKHGSAGNDDPPEFHGLADPYRTRDDLGPFVGSSMGNRYVYHLFMGVDENRPDRNVSLPDDLVDGTLELPSLTINGQRYEPQVLHFEQTRYFEISPVNC